MNKQETDRQFDRVRDDNAIWFPLADRL